MRFQKFPINWFRLFLSAFLSIVLTIVSAIVIVASGPGNLDTTFNYTGVVTTTVNGKNISGTSVVIQPNGRILVAGTLQNSINQNFVVTRYLPNGKPDKTFNLTGTVIAPVGDGYLLGSDIAIQSNGRIIVAGSDDFGAGKFQIAAVRYQQNGSLDTTFANGGVLTTSTSNGNDFGYAVSVQPDDNILIAGRLDTESAILRYTVTGTLDSTFNGDGIAKIDSISGEVYDLDIKNDKIIAVGVAIQHHTSNFLVTRYNVNGKLDTTFNSIGVVTTSITTGTNDIGFNGVAVQSNNKIVAAGEGRDSNNAPVIILVRYNANGSLDTEFNGTGVVTTSIGSGVAAAKVAVQADGKIVVVGTGIEDSKSKFVVVRYNPDGSLDAEFGDAGIVTSIFEVNGNTGRAVAIQNDGKIVVAGFGSTATVARYLDKDYPYKYYFPVILKSVTVTQRAILFDVSNRENYRKS